MLHEAYKSARPDHRNKRFIQHTYALQMHTQIFPLKNGLIRARRNIYLSTIYS